MLARKKVDQVAELCDAPEHGIRSIPTRETLSSLRAPIWSGFDKFTSRLGATSGRPGYKLATAPAAAVSASIASRQESLLPAASKRSQAGMRNRQASRKRIRETSSPRATTGWVRRPRAGAGARNHLVLRLFQQRYGHGPLSPSTPALKSHSSTSFACMT